MSQSNTPSKKGRLSLKKRNGETSENTNISQSTDRMSLLSLLGVADVLESCKQTPNKGESSSPIKKIKLHPSPVGECTKYVGINTNESITKNCLDFCPNCQMPFESLIKQSTNWHITECLEFNFQNLKECSSGSSCTSTIPSHYMKYTHYQLAEARSKIEKCGTAVQDSTSVSPTKIQDNTSVLPTKVNNEHAFFNSTRFGTLVKRELFPLEKFTNAKDLDEINNSIKNTTTINNRVDKEYDFHNCSFGFDENHIEVKSTECNFQEKNSNDVMDHDGEETNMNEAYPISLPTTIPSFESVSTKLLGPNEFEKCGFVKSESLQNDAVFELCNKQKSPAYAIFDHDPHPSQALHNQPLNYVNLKSKKNVIQKKVGTFPQKAQTVLTSFFKPLIDKNSNPKVQLVEFTDVKYDAEQTKSNFLKSSSYTMNGVQMSKNPQNNSTNGRKNRSCPFYKKIPDTNFVVDAFSYGDIPGVQYYFLSHFHSDHYTGLNKNFKHPVYCSLVTANLLVLKIRLPMKFIRILTLNEAAVINNVEVTALDANHCPGSIMFLFRLLDGRCILHTGDFRAVPEMERCPILKSCQIQKLFLDTTYCNPRYDFPPQDNALKFITTLLLQKINQNSRILVACGSYTIGKERVFMAIAESIGCKVWANKWKLDVLKCLEDQLISSRLVTDANLAQVHVLPMQLINIPKLQEYLTGFSHVFDEIIGLKPTGWEHTSSGSAQNLLCIKPKCQGRVSVYGVPYSEHSSFSELRRFVKFIQPTSIVPTVNVGKPKSRELMNSLFQQWLN